jgi:hypothetical protein
VDLFFIFSENTLFFPKNLVQIKLKFNTKGAELFFALANQCLKTERQLQSSPLLKQKRPD